MPLDKVAFKKLSIEQKINRLKEKESKLKEIERKERNRKIFELGGLLAKAKLDHLNSDQLYGALLTLSEQSHKPDNLSQWAKKGGSAFANENKSKGTPVIVTFNDKPDLEIRKCLRELGLKWNSFREEWQGLVDFNLTQEFVANHNGSVQEVKAVQKSPEQ